jgi:SAM-dependent methyltransferase
MFERTVSPEDLARRRVEREDADRRYNQALTALDGALPRVPGAPAPPPPPDDTQAAALNERWRLVAEGGAAWPGGVRGRLARFVWGVIGPYLERQQAFNAALVDHVNRNLPVQHETRDAVERAAATLLEHAAALGTFHSELIVYLQQLTPYVDTKDLEHAALARRVHEDNRELIDGAMQQSRGVAAALSGVGDESLKRFTSLLARVEQVAQAATLAQQTSLLVKREIERALAGRAAAGRDAEQAARTPVEDGAATVAGETPAAGGRLLQQAGADTLDAFKYVGFEDRFRGSRDEIRARLQQYVPLFAGASNVLDVGCGRGEFLELLGELGIPARGIDLNRGMVETCRALGLDVTAADVVSYLEGLEDETLGGLIAVQVVEHLQPDYLLRFLELAHRRLVPGAPLVLETINPGCWYAFFQSYIRDITHVRPVHPDTLSHYVTASGFKDVSVRYSTPYPEAHKLVKVEGGGPIERALNVNAERLNQLLFTYMDFAVVGTR